MMTRL